ncbi:MAG: hypothetical protein AAF598_11650 [Bacteroidota bacterium]
MVYEQRVVLFLDILGFKNIIDQTEHKHQDLPEQIARLYETLTAMRRYLSESGDQRYVPSLQLTQFSDAILVSFREDEESQVLQTLHKVQNLLVKLLLRGIICRGGIAYGKLIHDGNLTFGPALIDAYETESQAATYPRVVLNRTIIELGKKYHALDTDEKTEGAAIRNILQKDTDDLYYVDYFPRHYQDFGLDPQQMIEYLKRLRRIIQNGLKHRKVNIRSKYGWMKNKHNQMIYRIQDGHFGLPDQGADHKAILPFYDQLVRIR